MENATETLRALLAATSEASEALAAGGFSVAGGESEALRKIGKILAAGNFRIEDFAPLFDSAARFGFEATARAAEAAECDYSAEIARSNAADSRKAEAEALAALETARAVSRSASEALAGAPEGKRAPFARAVIAALAAESEAADRAEGFANEASDFETEAFRFEETAAHFRG